MWANRQKLLDGSHIPILSRLKLSIMNHLKCLCWAVILPFCLQAQIDLSYFPHYHSDLMEDLGVTDAQIQAIEVLERQKGAEKSQLYDALLYRPDLMAALSKVDAAQEAAMHKILTEAQQTAYQQFNVDILAEQRITDLKRYKDLYLEVYRYLKIKEEQAQLLAELEIAFRDGERRGENYATAKTNLLSEILKPKQWKKYERKRKKERFETTTLMQSGAITDVKALIAEKEREIKQLKEVYIPKRNALRQSLEAQLSPQDQRDIQYLRQLYREVEGEQCERIVSDMDYAKVLENLCLLRSEQFIQPAQIADLVHYDRPTFEKAKALGIKFDQAIDALQPALWQASIAAYGREKFFMRGYKEVTKENTMTDKVELNRNIAFLLAPAEIATTTTAISAAEMTAYPNPALTMQSLAFELKQAGEVRIELLDTQGKLIDVLLEEAFMVGSHKREFDLSKVNAGVFFYRLESAEGTKLLKSLKVK